MVLGASILCGMLPDVGLGINLYVLSSSLFFLGFSLACVDISINTQASIIEKLTRASLMGSFYGWYSIGGVAGVLSGGLMQSANINIFHSFSIISACCVFLSALFSLKLVSRDDIKDITMITFSPDETNRIPTSDTASVTRVNRMIVYLSLLGFLCNLGTGSMVDWSTIYLSEVMGFTPFYTSLAFTLFSVFLGIGRFSSDYLMNTFGAGIMLSLTGLLSSLGFLIVVLAPSLPLKHLVIYIGFSLLGYFVSFGFPVVNTIAGRIPGKKVEEVFVYTIPVSYVAFLLGPPVMGWLSEAAGSLRYSFIVVGGLIFLVFGIAQVMPREIIWLNASASVSDVKLSTLGNDTVGELVKDIYHNADGNVEEGKGAVGDPRVRKRRNKSMQISPSVIIPHFVNGNDSRSTHTTSASSQCGNSLVDFEAPAEYQDGSSDDVCIKQGIV